MGNVKMQKVDLCVIQDNELAQVFLKTEKKPAVATVVVIDQTVPPNSPEVSGLHKALREKAEKENIPCYYGKGMCGKLLADGLLKAGERAVTCDKAAGAAGAIGAQVTCADPTQLKQVLETGELLLEEPENGALKETVKLTGKLLEGLSAKDLALSLVKELGAENLAGKLLSLTGDTLEDKSLEFCGTAIDALGIDGRMTIANMVVECGGKAGLFAADQKCADYCGVDYEDVKWVKADEDAEYERVLTYKAEDLEPVLSCPPYVDNVHPLSEVKGVRLDQVFIGSCTNGRLEDLKIAANVMKGKKISSHVKCIVTPASNSIMEEAMKEGYIQTLVEAGALVTPPYCSFCEGRTMGLLSDDEVVLGTNNRNFLGRYGSPKAKAYLSSPEVAAASAVMGVITDPAELS